jgi:hypothetical protein
MSQMKMVAVMENMMEQSIEEAVRTTVRTMWKEKTHDELDDFVHELMMALGLRVGIMLGGIKMPVRRTPPPPAVVQEDSDDDYSLIPALEKAPVAEVSAPASVASDGDAGKDRKRTVSKKMKDFFLAPVDEDDPKKGGAGGSEESLKPAMKMYKSADQSQIDAWGGKWESFARAFVAGECAPAKKPAKTPAPKPKAKKEADPDAPKKAPKAPKEAKNFTWTPTAKKLFTEVVEGNGGKVTDELKTEFVAHVNGMDAGTYKMIAPVGHVRAFISSKAPGLTTTSEPPAPADDTDDEDQEEFEFEGETLWIGVISGKIHRQTKDSGDVQIGFAGEGKFKDVKIPSA